MNVIIYGEVSKRGLYMIIIRVIQMIMMYLAKISGSQLMSSYQFVPNITGLDSNNIEKFLAQFS